MSLSREAWAFLGVSVAEFTGMVTAITVAHIKTAAKVEEAKEGAQQDAAEVKKLAEPTGDGFADDVRSGLRRIEDKIDDHIAAHADRDVRGRR